MSRRVLVTGGTGFLGSPVSRLLVARGDDVHVASRSGEAVPGATPHGVDLLDPAASQDLISAVQPVCLVHLAWVTDHGTYWADPVNRAWRDATLSLFRAFANGSGRHIVAAGSCAEYDWTVPGPYAEDAIAAPATLYGQCKTSTHEQARSQLRDTGVTLCWARLFHLYGRGEHPDRLVPSLMRTARTGTAPAPRNPDNVIDLLHVHDAARAFVALSDTHSDTVINVAGGVAHSLSVIAAEIAELHSIAPAGRTEVNDDVSVITADVDRLRNEIGFSPEIDLTTGLATCAGALANPT